MAEVANDRGRAAMKSARFAAAERAYTDAIEASPDEAKYYSNRAASRMKIGHSKYGDALSDGKKAVELDKSYVKGYIRCAEASLLLSGRAAAARHISAGLQANNDDASLKDWLARHPAPSMTENVIGMARLFAFINAVAYIFPFTPAMIAFSCFRRSIFACILITLVVAFTTHGKPRWDVQYAQSLLMDTSSRRLFFYAVFIAARPYALALAPILLLEGAAMGAWAWQVSEFWSRGRFARGMEE